MELKDLGNVPFDLNVIRSAYPSIASIQNKASKLERDKSILRLKRGLYVNDPHLSGEMISLGLIANHIYGPSYISLETALRYYGLTPERVRSIRSMTTKHTRSFNNTLGLFEYVKCPAEYFSVGISIAEEGGKNFLIASPEKALCDLLITQSNSDIRSKRDLQSYLRDNLRLDMDRFHVFDKEIIRSCLVSGKKERLIENLANIV